MSDLKCSVENCVYNKDCLCSKGDIMVGNKHADRKSDTCCESFREAGESNAFTSAISHPTSNISIDCEATKCIYNTDYKCYAEHVDIKGCGASDCGGKNFATFKTK